MGPAPKIKNNETSCPTSSRVMMVLIIICPSFWSKSKCLEICFLFKSIFAKYAKQRLVKNCPMTSKRKNFYAGILSLCQVLHQIMKPKYFVKQKMNAISKKALRAKK